MTFGYIIEGIAGALICWFICGGWYLLSEWIENISIRRWEKKYYKGTRRKR